MIATKTKGTRITKLRTRTQVKNEDTWDLVSLFAGDEKWSRTFDEWEKLIPRYERFRGTLADVKSLVACLKFHLEFERLAERLGTYAFLRTAEDTSNSNAQRMQGRFQNAASRAGQAASFLQPELMEIPDAELKKLLSSRTVVPYRFMLEKWLRYKAHTLSDREEKLLAMQSEMAQTASHVFRQLNNADLKFGMIKNEKGEVVELSHASYSALLHSPKRAVRKAAFQQYYRQFEGHQFTLAATLSGSVQRDVYYAQSRRYPSALEAALFPDHVPLTVYDNLITTVRGHLPDLYRYYEIRRRRMRLDEIHHYDTYIPILSDLETHHSWKQAVKTVMGALKPLGQEYCAVLEKGLSGRWCDKYENVGKQSGAFSCGSFEADPFILMNYQPTVLDHVFTLAHEAGHSMHSYLSAHHQPFQYYDYTIFVAEVASTVNEQLLSRHLLSKTKDDRERAFLINRQIDDIRGTILRQTMFAEFEKRIHALAESNEPLTLDRFKTEYHELLQAYFGPHFSLDPELDLECFRIPHFYRAFYVYKYATGMSAAISLANKLLEGEEAELTAYLSFLKGGCSKFPLELLQDAGVDMRSAEPIDRALDYFGELVSQLDELL